MGTSKLKGKKISLEPLKSWWQTKSFKPLAANFFFKKKKKKKTKKALVAASKP
jgi:hypothetical protein